MVGGKAKRQAIDNKQGLLACAVDVWDHPEGESNAT